MDISERDVVRRIYALPETCTGGDLVAAFEMNPCTRAKDFILWALRGALYPLTFPKDPEICKLYIRISNTQCKY